MYYHTHTTIRACRLDRNLKSEIIFYLRDPESSKSPKPNPKPPANVLAPQGANYDYRVESPLAVSASS